ncbi:type IV secretory system conjugative DNA transfer family protein [Lentzea sp. JNUCC 0626]|uniref:type IV secretory system conjugative DNA transfer family protein n=1 Tax=Lentzea sp. JNUCC 0626 TaxID=3367513 RepID=UPI0037484347
MNTSLLHDFLRDPTSFGIALWNLVRPWLTAWGPILGGALLAAAGGVAMLRTWCGRRHHLSSASNARLVTVLAPPSAGLAGAEMLWSNLIGLLRQRRRWLPLPRPHVSFEYHFSSNGLQIVVWVPGIVPSEAVERAIEAAWPGVRTRTAPAQPLVEREEQSRSAGGAMRLARCAALPIRTDFAVDPLRTLFGATAGLGSERVVVQVLARPASRSRTAKTSRAARSLGTGSSSRGLDSQERLSRSADDRAIVAKLRTCQYETLVRYAVTGPQSKGRAHAIGSAFSTYSAQNHFRRARLRNPVQSVASRRFRHGDLLSISELAALAHLPLDEAAPGVQRAGAKAVPPPPGVAHSGKPIGRSDSGLSRPIGLAVADARHHVHIMGATGSGKSELMARMILADAEAGRGLVVIDPKGDLVGDLLQRLPQRLGQKVVLFDADSSSRPPVLNPLEGKDSARAVDNLMSIFSRVYSSSWGPRTDDILRVGLLTLTCLPGTPTLTDLPKLLTVTEFRRHALTHLTDEVLIGFWKWYAELSDASRAQVIAPLMNKVRGFLLRPFVRASIAGGASTFDMDDVLDGGICLVRIARGTLGMETAKLIGSIIVARTWQTAVRRARLPHHQRRDCGLYIDECHNFLNRAA